MISIGPRSAALPVALTVEQLAEPWHAAHRGGLGQNVTPESMIESWKIGLDAGHQAQDGGDLRVLGDGTIVSIHDQDVDALTDGTGDLAKHSAQSWGRLRGDVSAWTTPRVPFVGWPDMTPATFEDILELFKRRGNVVFFPENKEQGDVAQATRQVEMIQRHALERSCVFSSFQLADLAPAVAAGMKVMVIASGSTHSVANQLAAGVDYYAYDKADTTRQTPAFLATVAAAGIKLVPFTIQRRSELAAELARIGGLPIAGVFSDDAMWTADTAAVLSSDPYESQTHWVGCLPYRAGVFRAGGKWGLDSSGRALQGWGSRAANQGSIEFTVTLENNIADATRWAAINFFCTDDRDIFNGNWPASAAGGGYRLLIRQNGQVGLYALDPGASPQLGATVSGTALAPGGSAVLKIEALADGVLKISRDGAQILSVTHAAHRGGYFTFVDSDNDAGLQVSFSDVTLTL